MDAKKLVTGAAAGTVAQMLFGWLIFQVLVASFYEANFTGAADLLRETPLIWATVLGNISLAVLVTLAVDWTKAHSLAKGFKVGALVGFLLWFGVHFNMYSGMNLTNLTVIIVDPLLEAIRTGITGAAIGFVMGRFFTAEPA